MGDAVSVLMVTQREARMRPQRKMSWKQCLEISFPSQRYAGSMGHIHAPCG